MVRAGDVLENPRSGERFTFVQTAAETNGKLLQFELLLRPGGRVPAAHLHARQDERFAVLSGTAHVVVDGVARDVRAGESVIVPPGTAHALRNESAEDALLRVELRPAMNTEALFEAMCALAMDGRVSRSGLPNPLRVAVLHRALRLEDYAPGIPIVVQKLAFLVLAPLGRALGYKARYP